jgi:hypothetical protein
LITSGVEAEKNEEAMEAILDSIIKMDHYVNVMGKPRSHYWREFWSRGVMELISKNAFDIKTASELLGVSYAVLYAKYREQYGYRKPPSASKLKAAGSAAKPQPAETGEPAGLSPPASFLDQSGQGLDLGKAARGSRRRNNIDWGSERVRAVCAMIAERKVSIKKGSEILGIDYSTLYYHLARHAPPGGLTGRGRGRKSSAAAAGGAAIARKGLEPAAGGGANHNKAQFSGGVFKSEGPEEAGGTFVASVSINPAPLSS